jgi:hypothetical protein
VNTEDGKSEIASGATHSKETAKKKVNIICAVRTIIDDTSDNSKKFRGEKKPQPTYFENGKAGRGKTRCTGRMADARPRLRKLIIGKV